MYRHALCFIHLLFTLALAGCPQGCGPGVDDAGSSLDADGGILDGGEPDGDGGSDGEDAGLVLPLDVEVLVRLDGDPVGGAIVLQGGYPPGTVTDDEGRASLTLEPFAYKAQIAVVVSHPDARQDARLLDAAPEGVIEFDLVSFDKSDNEAFVFRDPGDPKAFHDSSTCAHCHVDQFEQWYGSAHRQSASNPVVLDVFDDVIAQTDSFGGCADCHAPGIDGVLGGRSLNEAEGRALDNGVHCDVCHLVESIDLDAPPGVGGRLHIVRPSETTENPLLGEWLPLAFGPYPDAPTFVMGSVQREHFREATFCAGCHEHAQGALSVELTPDPVRWPDGTLGVHTTYSEWLASGLAPSTPCQACHMPPDLDVNNSGTLNPDGGDTPGLTEGWFREPGTVMKHSFLGPRAEEGTVMESPVAVAVTLAVENDVATVTTSLTNQGAGHALPTGDPLRAYYLLVDASCDGAPLTPLDGLAVPVHGGALEVRDAGDDLTTWPDATSGERLLVVRRPGTFVDMPGSGPFGDGSFSLEQRGLVEERVTAARTIVDVADDGTVTLDDALPAGEVVYRLPAASPDEAPHALAGAPGYAFAKVLASSEGELMVPHFRAVDVVSDNRLLPGVAVSLEHTFAATCASPSARARLVSRALPLGISAERDWDRRDRVLADVTAP